MKQILLIIVFLAIVGCEAPEKADKEVLLSVGSSELTLNILEREIPTSLKSSVNNEQINNFIQQWIETELIYQSAMKRGMDLDSDFRYEFEKAKKQLLVRKYIERVINEEMNVTEEEIRQYYEGNKDNFKIGHEEIRALHILVSSKSEANAVLQRLTNGDDFKTVAKEVSLDYSEHKRIEMDFFSRNDILPEIASRLFRYQVGRTTQPIKSDYGWHIFKVLEKRREGDYKELEEVRENIASRLAFNKRTDTYKALITELRSKTRVIINQDALNNILTDSTAISKNNLLE